MSRLLPTFLDFGGGAHFLDWEVKSAWDLLVVVLVLSFGRRRGGTSCLRGCGIWY